MKGKTHKVPPTHKPGMPLKKLDKKMPKKMSDTVKHKMAAVAKNPMTAKMSDPNSRAEMIKKMF